MIPDVKADPRFLWVRGLDQRRFVTSMLSVPLSWHDQTVGVLNVQTERPRVFSPSDVAQLERGRRPPGRHRREGPPAIGGGGPGRVAQGDRRGAQRAHRPRHPRAADARWRSCARTPTCSPRSRSSPGANRATSSGARPAPTGTGRRSSRSSGSTASSTRSWRRSASCRRTRRRSRRWTSRRSSPRCSARCEPLLGRHHVDAHGAPRLHALADPPRLRQIIEHLVENAVKYAPSDTTITIDWALVEGRRPPRHQRRGPGHPRRMARADLRAVRAARHAHGARLGHRAVRREATR